MSEAATHVQLVDPMPDHAATWLRWRQEPQATLHMPLLDLSEEKLRERLARTPSNLKLKRKSEHRWMVAYQGELVGTVSVVPSWAMGLGEIGCHIAAEHQKQGVGRAAVIRLLARLFGAAGLRKVFATIHVENEASIRLVRRLGFVQEGLLKEHYLLKGAPCDQVMMGLLARDWVNPSGE